LERIQHDTNAVKRRRAEAKAGGGGKKSAQRIRVSSRWEVLSFTVERYYIAKKYASIVEVLPGGKRGAPVAGTDSASLERFAQKERLTGKQLSQKEGASSCSRTGSNARGIKGGGKYRVPRGG